MGDRKKVIRVTVVGDGYTGKTCILIVYKDKKYNNLYIPTVFDSYSMNIDIGGRDYRLILSDTAGQEDYDRLRPLAYNDTDVFIICYSVDKVDSYHNVKLKWNKEVRHYRPNAKVILVGTKIDLRDHRNSFLNFEDGLKLKSEIKADDFFECSAKELYNINEIFRKALLLAIQPPPQTQRQRPCFIL